jgi:hypothetical protein
MNKLFPLFFSFLGFSSLCFGQVNDAGLWTSLDIQKDIGKRFNLDGNVELRFNENVTELGTCYGEASLGYELHKRVDVSVGYRFIGKRRLDDSYSFRHRLIFNLSYRKKFNKFSAAIRVRYQSQFTDVSKSENWQVPEEYLRTKLTLKYDTDKKWNPFAAAETFYQLGGTDGILFNEYRLSAGVDYDFTKRSSLSLAYIFDREVQVSNPWTNYVVSIGWKYQF